MDTILLQNNILYESYGVRDRKGALSTFRFRNFVFYILKIGLVRCTVVLVWVSQLGYVCGVRKNQSIMYRYKEMIFSLRMEPSLKHIEKSPEDTSHLGYIHHREAICSQPRSRNRTQQKQDTFYIHRVQFDRNLYIDEVTLRSMVTWIKDKTV